MDRHRVAATDEFEVGDPLGVWTPKQSWTKTKLWDLAEYINGRAFKPSDLGAIGLHVIKITELKNGVSETTSHYLGNYEEKHLLRDGDLLFAWSGNPETSLDAFVWRGGPALLNQHIFRVIPGPRINKTYLFCLLKYLRPTFIRTARDKATSMGHVKVSDLKRLIAYVPPELEQEAIASILKPLEDKIELNRRMNETLEAIARAIFKSWFVDFDPARAKAEGRRPSGMNANTAALFPNSFEDSSLGKNPKGWGVATLPEAVEINPHRSLGKNETTTYLDMQNMPTRGHRVLGWTRRPFVSGSKFSNGDTLVARITPCLENGKTAFVDFLQDSEVAWGSTEFIVLRPKEPLPAEYAYCLARDEDFRAHAIQNMTGSSGRQRVAISCFSQYFVTVPPKAVAHSFGQIIQPLFAKAKVNSEEATTLEAIRDSLLPKLISGEIRIKDAEKIVGGKV